MYDYETRRGLAEAVAAVLRDGAWTAEAVAERGAGALDRRPRWMSGLALEIVSVYRSPPSRATGGRFGLIGLIESFLARLPETGTEAEAEAPVIIRLLGPLPPRSPRRPDWPVAAVDSVPALAEALELSVGQLAWLADVRSLERTVTNAKLRNYRYRTLARGGGLPRVIESPKARLKEIQRWVLRSILDQVPAHDAAHGFVRGRSVAGHARLHVGRDVVLRFDLKDFFASIAAARVHGIFRTLGYTSSVAHTLTGLCTNVVPLAVWTDIARMATSAPVQSRFWLGRELATPHLPQGAPTSPALANLAGFGLDRRLTGLAAALDLRYSRYADDLTFSGSHQVRARSAALQRLVAQIASEEGFVLNRSKTLLRTAASRQSVCGVVVNAHPNVTRAEYDRLKAILHNAARDGPDSQNRDGLAHFDAHLRGRIEWVASLNPVRGESLRRRFGQIDWLV
jgi:RNA-directed DNA polymerase